MQEDLNKLCKWSEENGMLFNVSKCGIMHVGKKRPGEVEVKGRGDRGGKGGKRFGGIFFRRM